MLTFWKFLGVRLNLDKKIEISWTAFWQSLSLFSAPQLHFCISAHNYDLVLIFPHHYRQFSRVLCTSSGNDFHKSFYCFYLNGIIFLPHMSN